MITSQRKCRSCGEHKPTADNFRKFASGKYYNRCNDCVNNVSSKVKCSTCNEFKDKSNFNDPRKLKCSSCRNKEQKSSKTKIDDNMMINVSPNSFEVAMSHKSSAELSLQKAKQREKEIINNGGRFIKRGIRAYVLTR